jgi:transcriptional regulator with XRE-family HTH domain
MLGNRIKKLREEKNIKQEDLAKKVNVSPSAIGMYERDLREPNDEITLKLAEFFNVTTDYLLGKSDIRNPEELKKVPFANAGGLNTEGLEEEDLLELQKQINYIKKIKGKNNGNIK